MEESEENEPIEEMWTTMTEDEWGTKNATIKGLTSLLMNKLTVKILQESGKGITKKKKEYDPDEEARAGAYIDTIDGVEQLNIPWINLYSCILGGSGGYKVGNVTASKILAGAIRITPQHIPLKPAFVDGKPNYVVDVRPANIHGARVTRARAKVWPWEASFQIRYLKESIETDAAKDIEDILRSAGITQGLMDYRPQHKGWFGTFEVVDFT